MVRLKHEKVGYETMMAQANGAVFLMSEKGETGRSKTDHCCQDCGDAPDDAARDLLEVVGSLVRRFSGSDSGRRQWPWLAINRSNKTFCETAL